MSIADIWRIRGTGIFTGAPEGLRWFYQHGYRLIVITNQSAVGRGMLSADGLERIHERFHEMVNAVGSRIEQIYSCPHVPDDKCSCRKPSTGLLLQAAADRHFDASKAIVIGDKSSDVEMGRRVGATTILIARDRSQVPQEARPDYITKNLLEAARAIVQRDIRAPGYCRVYAMTLSVAVIGAGWYGCHIGVIAQVLGFEVSLFEQNERPLHEASGIINFGYTRGFTTQDTTRPVLSRGTDSSGLRSATVT